MLKDHNNPLLSQAQQLGSTTKNECGCKSGMVALVIGLSISTYFYFFSEPNATHIVLKCLYVLLISLCFAVIGKIAGMLVPKVRRRFKKNSNKKENSYVTPSL